MTREEENLLEWLGKEPHRQYGECHGAVLDSLIGQGLAQVHEGREHQSGRIVQGDSLMHRAVSLTRKGREALVRFRLKRNPPKPGDPVHRLLSAILGEEPISEHPEEMRPWMAWIREVERLLGKRLDCNSVDSAYDYFASKHTPQEYVDDVNANDVRTIH